MKLLSFDIGAGSGRAFLSDFDGSFVNSKEIYRFDNKPFYLGDTLYWNFLDIMENVGIGLRKAASDAGTNIHSVGVDTWGVDFGMLDCYGDLISNPVSYRDKRTSKIGKYIYEIIPKDELFKLNSTQVFNFCTLFQLYYLYKFRKETAKVIKTILLMPNLINYFLTGEKFVDPSILSASQFYDVKSKSYRKEILRKLGIPDQILPSIAEAGTLIRKVKKEFATFANLPADSSKISVVLTCSHDSSSMVTGIPLDDAELNSCYINSGTWSVIGIENKNPIVNDSVIKSDFTNWRTFRENNMFLKAFNGFYFLQECKKIWELEDGKEISHDEFYKDIKIPKQKTALIDLSSTYLENDEYNMPERIINYFKLTNQKIERLRSNIIISLLQSMVIESKLSLDELEKITGKNFDKIYMVGGGSKNEFFCQWIADCLGREIHTGYHESTINGNIISQLFALGEIKSLNEGRKIIRDSNKEKIYFPDKLSSIDWERLINYYLNLKTGTISKNQN